MKKLTAALLSATMLLSLCPACPQGSYDIKAVAAETSSAKFDEDDFYVVVGKYGEFTQLRYLVRRSDGSYSAEKVVWETAPVGLVYGDVLTAEGKVLMEQVRPANDPVYAMAYYYKLDDSAKLTKVGKCSALMELKDLVVKSVTYDGSAHWSIDYTDTSGLKKYYYGLSTFGSSLGVDPISCKEGDIYTFAAINGNIVIPLAKKEVQSEEHKEPEYRIVKLPDKVEYKLGEYISLKGLQIEVKKDGEEPVIYTYPDVAFAHDSNTPSAPKVLLYTDFHGDKAGTYKVGLIEDENISFNVKVVDNDVTTTTATTTVTSTTTTTTAPVETLVFDGTKKMTLDDVWDIFNRNGAELSWSDFKEFKGERLNVDGSEQQYKFGIDYTCYLLLTGNPPESPTHIFLVCKDQKGVDVRVDDVIAFLLEKAAVKVTATVMEINGNTVIVKPDAGSEELRSSERFNLPSRYLGDIMPTAGMRLEITYMGGILETYPPQFAYIHNVTLVSDVPEIVKGDANCDNTVNMADAVLIMQALANPNKYGENGTYPLHLTAFGKLNADANGDGLTVGDALDIQKILLGLNDIKDTEN